MIYIKKGEINRVILTLSENSTIDNPNYLFVFENILGSKLYLTTNDISDHKIRYNKFIIRENDGGHPDFSDDEAVNMKPGQWKYWVYETSQSIDINNLNPDLNGFILIETGICVVNGSSNTDSFYD
jgi:hypothetical protein